MSDRLEELALRRRQLLLRSERLRSDLAADQQVMLNALSGVDRMYSIARRAGPPLLMAGAAAMLFKVLRRSRRGAAEVRRRGFAVKALFWITTARRVLPYLPLVKALWRSRFSQRAAPEDIAQSAQ